uniref:Uncharacterized protein n=1 Tax=Megaselia scalaris TaxID=36166 RepID=T1G9Z3_MEGSC
MEIIRWVRDDDRGSLWTILMCLVKALSFLVKFTSHKMLNFQFQNTGFCALEYIISEYEFYAGLFQT